MSDLRPRPLEPDLDRLLDAERAAPVPQATLHRVWSRVARSVQPGGPSGGSSNGPNGVRTNWLASNAGLLVALSFVAGGAVGAGLHTMLQKPASERVVYVDRPVPASIVPAPAAPATPATPSSSSPDRSPQPQPPHLSSTHSVPDASAQSSLSAERAILDGARTALAQDDGTRALNLTDEHGRRFTHPQLAEEREAIAIQALVLAGRHAEARARAARFEASSPNSLFLPAVEASLTSIP
jgi:hypothetical protein